MSEHQIIHIELSAKDRKALGKFYTELFDWEVRQDEKMNYAVFESGISGGLNPVQENYPAGTIIPYVTTDDVEATLNKAQALGGNVVQAKFYVPTVGDLGLFTDPTGNLIGVMKAEQV